MAAMENVKLKPNQNTTYNTEEKQNRRKRTKNRKKKTAQQKSTDYKHKQIIEEKIDNQTITRT